MSRVVWPRAFQLFSAGGSGEKFLKQASGVVERLLPKFFEKPPDPKLTGPPVSLRWVSAPNLGFPRQAFSVFRRRKDRVLTALISNVNISGTSVLNWGLREMYRVRVNVTPNSGQTLRVDALDRSGQVMPGQRITFSTGARGTFQAPGIASLRVTGTGTVVHVEGIEQNEFANLDGWEMIEVVGLPFGSR